MNKNLKIHDIVSTDLFLHYNCKHPSQWQPQKLEDIYFVLEFKIGYEDEEATDLFQTVIVTPEGIRKHEKDLINVIPGREFLIVFEYNWEAILAKIKEIIKNCECETWEESVERLTRYFLWEYEDHTPC